MRLAAVTKLHGPASLEARNPVCRYSILIIFRIDQVVPIRVVLREIEEVNTSENDEKSTKKGDRVDGIRGIESLEQNKRGAKRSGRKCDIVERVDTAKGGKY